MHPVLALCRLSTPFKMDVDADPRDMNALLTAKSCDLYYPLTCTWSQWPSVSHVIEMWQQHYSIQAPLPVVLLRLSPTLVSAILSGFGVLHIVGVSRRICRNRLLRRSDPSAAHIKKLMSMVTDVTRRRLQPSRAIVKKGWSNMHTPAIVFEWLAATLYVKQVRHIWQASQAFARIFAKHRACSIADVTGSIRTANFEVLRAARVRVDCIANNLFRRFWQTLPDDIDIFIYLDSSPQVCGQELFAASFELWDRHGQVPFARKLMPLVALMRDYLDAAGKAIALLWCIFLLVGPCPEQLIRFCDRVRCIVTDMGTERLIARCVDCLPEFFSIMLGVSTLELPDRSHLFPLALQSPGWMHGWDVILRRGLASLSFFPAWLDGMRALVIFSDTLHGGRFRSALEQFEPTRRC